MRKDKGWPMEEEEEEGDVDDDDDGDDGTKKKMKNRDLGATTMHILFITYLDTTQNVLSYAGVSRYLRPGPEAADARTHLRCDLHYAYTRPGLHSG